MTGSKISFEVRRFEISIKFRGSNFNLKTRISKSKKSFAIVSTRGEIFMIRLIQIYFNKLFFNIFFVGVPHSATYIILNFLIELELGAGINPGMAFTPFPCSILDETRFEPTIFRS